jgi:hypothetical protein
MSAVLTRIHWKESIMTARVPAKGKQGSPHRSLAAVLALALLSIASVPALAAHPPAEAPPPATTEKLLGALGVPDCACEIDVAELQRYRDLVAAASTAEEARALATRPSNLARRALGAAQRLAPWSGSLRDAHGKLLGYEGRVAKAQTPAEAAREFEGLVRLAGNGVSVGGNSGRCNYTTTEIIAIVLGFIFFIIPGIILLIVFC